MNYFTTPDTITESVTTLLEAFSAKDIGAANQLILQYLEKKLGKLVKMPGMETYSNSLSSGVGYRFFIKGTKKCFRLNWASTAASKQPNEITSIDVWVGDQQDPNITIKTKGASVAKILPTIADIIKTPKVGQYTAMRSEDLNESLLFEAKLSTEQAIGHAIQFLHQNATFGKVAIGAAIGHSKGPGFIDALLLIGAIERAGTKFKVVKIPSQDELSKAIGQSSDTISVVPGGHGDKSTLDSKQEESLQKKIPYEDQLKHLELLVRSVEKGAFNALFVAGPGGTGKTHTVEAVLEKTGRTDGDGYFKNTGSASALGIYSLLYRHKDDIILFDDCDSALADQEARNLIKAATDTKKSRKLVWNKKNSKMFDPADYGEDYEPEEEDMIPKYFHFTGRVIFISNLPLAKLDPDGALRTRAFVIEISPTNQELYDFMEKILDDVKLEDGLSLSSSERKKVFGLVQQSTKQQGVSIRKVVKALNLAASGITDNDAMLSDLIKLYCH